MTPRKLRDVLRSVHLVAAAILIVYLYTPVGANDVFYVMVRAMVVPVMVVTGLLMWQMPRMRRLMRSRRRPGADSPTHREEPAGPGRRLTRR